MQSLSLVMSECFVSGRGQGHVSNFYIVDLENFATASRRYTGDITTQRRWFVYDTCDNGSRLCRVMVECTLSITHCLRLHLQLHTIHLVRTCRISSFCTVAWQLARFQLTRRIARYLGDSWAFCLRYLFACELSFTFCDFDTVAFLIITTVIIHRMITLIS